MTSTPDWSQVSDGDLARRVIRRGDDAPAAESELCRRFGRRVRLYGLRHLRDAASADDLAQRVLLLTLEKLRSGAVREPDRIASFILGAARTLVHEQRRSTKPEVAVSPDGENLPPHPPLELDPIARTQLARCLQTLAERERSVLVLTYYGDAGSPEIARSLAMAEGHVRVVRHRAIGRLRACMGEPARPTAAGREATS